MRTLSDRMARREDIAQYCRRLSLSQTAAQMTEHATQKQEEFLWRVLQEEVAQREQNRRARLISRAGFPAIKTLASFDRGAVKLPSTLPWSDLESGQFITEQRNLVCYGPVGTGKTHMATALGLQACERGQLVRFFTVTALVVRLSEAQRTGTLERLMKELHRADMLILDEWGYVPLDRTGAQLLFRIVADSYETRSIVITTNLEFSKWGSIFADDQMAAAMIDRLAHHGQLLVFTGESYRMKHALMKER
ncbi:MAG: IS21-like element helper ATPase IstB [Sulfobacillus thermotolerans]|nr:IS21-like element helper ATPase IstB [Sulfobacillus thermotolerans]